MTIPSGWGSPTRRCGAPGRSSRRPNFLLEAEGKLRHVIAYADAAAVITSPEFADKVSEATAGPGRSVR